MRDIIYYWTGAAVWTVLSIYGWAIILTYFWRWNKKHHTWLFQTWEVWSFSEKTIRKYRPFGGSKRIIKGLENREGRWGRKMLFRKALLRKIRKIEKQLSK